MYENYDIKHGWLLSHTFVSFCRLRMRVVHAATHEDDMPCEAKHHESSQVEKKIATNRNLGMTLSLTSTIWGNLDRQVLQLFLLLMIAEYAVLQLCSWLSQAWWRIRYYDSCFPTRQLHSRDIHSISSGNKSWPTANVGTFCWARSPFDALMNE